MLAAAREPRGSPAGRGPGRGLLGRRSDKNVWPAQPARRLHAPCTCAGRALRGPYLMNGRPLSGGVTASSSRGLGSCGEEGRRWDTLLGSQCDPRAGFLGRCRGAGVHYRLCPAPARVGLLQPQRTAVGQAESHVPPTQVDPCARGPLQGHGAPHRPLSDSEPCCPWDSYLLGHRPAAGGPQAGWFGNRVQWGCSLGVKARITPPCTFLQPLPLSGSPLPLCPRLRALLAGVFGQVTPFCSSTVHSLWSTHVRLTLQCPSFSPCGPVIVHVLCIRPSDQGTVHALPLAGTQPHGPAAPAREMEIWSRWGAKVPRQGRGVSEGQSQDGEDCGEACRAPSRAGLEQGGLHRSRCWVLC